MNDLLKNIDKIKTTELGVLRIKRNLGLETDNVVEWCKSVISESEKTPAISINRKGKNWYICTPHIIITVNAYTYTIITAHKNKKL